MRRATLLALLLGVAALAAFEAPISATAPQDAAAQPAMPAQPEAPVPPEPTTAPVPAEPAPAPTAPPAPLATPEVAVPAEVPVPLPVPPPEAEFISPRQGVFGPLIRVPPAQKIAMLEVDGPVAGDAPLVGRASYLLSQLTAKYVEDAPRIAELTIRVCRAIRASGGSASPLEMMEGAEAWKRPALPAGNVPRRYEGYAALYRKFRLDQGKSHAEALALIRQGTAAPGPASTPQD